MPRLEPTRILVTGADGFIGSHLVERLARDGHRVRALACYNAFDSRGWLDALPAEVRAALEVVVGDVRDFHGIRAALTGQELVFHLAALIAIPYSYRAPRSYFETNALGTLHLLEAAREAGVRRFVHTSSSEVYGTARYAPIDEAHPLEAQSPYAASKIAADQMALAFHHSFGLPVSILRPFNTYGPRQSLRALVPTIIVQLLRGCDELALGNLEPTRDFSFVSDIVDAFLLVAAAPSAVGEVIHVGSGFELSVERTAAIIGEVLGAAPRVIGEPERKRPPGSEVERLVASTAKARELLDWAPCYGGEDGFRRGIAETAAWFSRPENLGRYPDRPYAL
jgi:dTDP-glucose 4,6-dehydratase